MAISNIEFFVEDASTEAFLNGLLPNILDQRIAYRVYPYNGKNDLIAKLPARLKGYSKWQPEGYRIVIIVDQDDDNCRVLKSNIENIAIQEGLQVKAASSSHDWIVGTRIAVEEIEAWLLGDVNAIRSVYPRVPITLDRQAKFRDPDSISGGTWEALERVLQRAGYFNSGLRKIEFAREVAPRLDPSVNRSRSFRCFVKLIEEMSSI